MTNAVSYTKISEIKNKIAVASDLVKKTNCEAKILKIEGKHIIISNYDKFTSDILDAKQKTKELVNKLNICNLAKNSDLHTKLATLATKAKLKAEQDKTVKLQTYHLRYFLGKRWWFSEYVWYVRVKNGQKPWLSS